MSATHTLSTYVAAKLLFRRSSAATDLLSRRVVPLLLPRMRPRSRAWRMSLSTRLRERRIPSARNSVWTLGEPYVRRLRSWIFWRILSVREPSARPLVEGSLPLLA